ncbi:cytochrome P450 3A21-like [Ixodes scapularis]|uniref:cytochrome P450 3A21-like n=1 Tax=Ixodes scapularis TaxID=6945 RepID=UPI001C385153|nr:cytochrome P450 3A21-like [Ixodes scapularis]
MKLLGVPDWIILVATALVLLYLYAARHRNYWKEQNVVQEDFSLIFATAKRILFKPFHKMDLDRYTKYGRLFGVYEGGKPVLFVGDPELVKLVLVKDFPSLPNRRVSRRFGVEILHIECAQSTACAVLTKFIWDTRTVSLSPGRI